MNNIPQRNVPLKDYTSWRVGGPAGVFYRPKDATGLAGFLAKLPDYEPIYYLGLGTNTLVRDGGIKGTVIYFADGDFTDITKIDNELIRVGVGVPCAKVAQFCARLGLEGVEFMAGIPGSVGGALTMNAGCFGSETWDFVTEVETVCREGKRHSRMPDEYQVSYRNVKGPENECFVSAKLRLKKGDCKGSLKKIRSLLQSRVIKQPTGVYCCGSVFRNPPGDFAARLIEVSGLKGKRLGGAYVSEKHANFIINDGDATAHEIESLIEQVEEKVKNDHGVILTREVKIVGEPR